MRKDISNLILSIILFVLARVLATLLIPISVFATIVRFILYKKDKRKSRIHNISEYFWKLAIADDQKGNVACSYIFNKFFWDLPNGGYPSGNPDESISSVTGKNKAKGTLKPLGKALDWILNKLDPGHSIDAIEVDEDKDGRR